MKTFTMAEKVALGFPAHFHNHEEIAKVETARRRFLQSVYTAPRFVPVDDPRFVRF